MRHIVIGLLGITLLSCNKESHIPASNTYPSTVRFIGVMHESYYGTNPSVDTAINDTLWVNWFTKDSARLDFYCIPAKISGYSTQPPPGVISLPDVTPYSAITLSDDSITMHREYTVHDDISGGCGEGRYTFDFRGLKE